MYGPPEFKFGLGVKVKDIVTGFQGIVDYRVQYLTGCNRYGVQPTTLDKDKKILKAEVFDENRLKCLKSKPVVIKEDKKVGGDKNPIEEKTI